MASIYGLLDTQGRLRYIGKANNPAERLKSHMREATRRDYPLHRWLRKHGAPTMIVLVENSADWREDEKTLIAGFREQGEPLLNVADGGDQPHTTTEHLRTNALTLNRRLKSDPVLERVRKLKAEIGRAASKGWLTEAQRAKGREIAAIRPDLFGSWSTL